MSLEEMAKLPKSDKIETSHKLGILAIDQKRKKSIQKCIEECL